MSVEPYLFKATTTILHLGIREGDVVVVRPGSERAIVVQHVLPPNYGAIVGAVTAGQLTPLHHSSDDVLGVLAELTRALPAQPQPLPLKRRLPGVRPR